MLTCYNIAIKAQEEMRLGGSFPGFHWLYLDSHVFYNFLRQFFLLICI